MAISPGPTEPRGSARARRAGRREPGRSGASALVQDIILAHVHDAVFATDIENRVTFWGPSAERLFGYAANEAVGRSFGDLLPYHMEGGEDDATFFSALRAGRTWRGTGTIRLRDGTERWIESAVQPIIEDGRWLGSVSVSRDITDSVRAQRALLEQERFVDAIVDTVGALVLVLDATGRIVRFNRACERMSGYAYAEVAEQFVWDSLLPESEVSAVRAAFEALAAGDFPATFENHWRTRDGAVRLIAWSSTCLVDRDGAVTHVIGTGLDITERRSTADALHGIETVGRLLASAGPTDDVLHAVLGRLSAQMGYGHLTLLIREDDRWRLGAQLGYTAVPAYFDPAVGVIGRVIRTGEPAFVRDVLGDADYRADSPEVRSEICVPLRAEGETLGVLDIESTAEAPLTGSDLQLALAVADRLATAMLLGREQLSLRERARVFAALTEFGHTVNAIHDTERLWPELVAGVGSVVTCDLVSLTVLDRTTGEYIVRAVAGTDPSIIGTRVQPGDGAAGRAIAGRGLVEMEDRPRDSSADPGRDLVGADTPAVLAAPLIREGTVLGALVLGRARPRTFSGLDREATDLLAAHAALAVSNAHLLEEVSELAIHDALTGLYNRRHFDAEMDHMAARWRRHPEGGPVAAIMFDLDHFGVFNREHGHQAGDQVLREFAGVLRERVRSADLVARYGGEEFVVILEGCDLEGAVGVAEAVRTAFGSRSIPCSDGTALHATVSAGCAALDPRSPTREELLRSADVGLYMAKRAGRDQVVAVRS